MLDERERLLYEFPCNVVVAASAGTGKTHHLVGLYIHLVGGLTDIDSGSLVSPESIVATTFTREASSEMRTRIDTRLRMLATHSLDELQHNNETKAWALELIRTCERRRVVAPERERWLRALEALPRATISTFHAWAGDLLRSFPMESGVPPNFVLLEPEENEAIFSRVARNVILNWIDDDSPAVLMNDSIVHSISPLLKSEAIRTMLIPGISSLIEAIREVLVRATEEGVEPYQLGLADREDDWKQSILRKQKFLDMLKHTVEATCSNQAISKLNVKEKEKLEQVQSLWEDAQNVLDVLAQNSKPDPHLNRTLAKLFKELHQRFKRESSHALNSILCDVPNVPDGVFERIFLCIDGPARNAFACALDQAARALLTEISIQVRKAKYKARGLDFSDMLKAARDLLLVHPQVQREVASSIKALLVDEFQDTNALQRDIVYLVRQRDESIQERNAGERPTVNTLQSKGLFLVGDRKQSIYGFRGADVSVFQEIAIDLAGPMARKMIALEHVQDSIKENCSVSLGQLVPLEINRRSTHEILHFINEFTEIDMKSDERLHPIERVIFNDETEKLRATYELLKSETLEEKPLQVVVPTIDFEHLKSPDTNEDVSTDLAAALGVAEEIDRILKSPTDFRFREPLLQASEIAILIRSYKIVSALEFALDRYGISYTITARKGLYTTTEAADLEALVRLALDRYDRYAALTVLRGPWVALSDDALLLLCSEYGLEFFSHVRENIPISSHERRRLLKLNEALDDLVIRAERVGVATALQHTFDRLGVEKILAMLPGAERRLRDLRKLMQIAEHSSGGLAGFARQLERGRNGEIDEARGASFDRDENSVRILTMHAAKGLEFRVVFAMQMEHRGSSGERNWLALGRRNGQLSVATRVDRAGHSYWGDGARAVMEHVAATERAERQRLTYVALTRAQELLYVISASRQTPIVTSAAYSVLKLLERQPSIAQTPTWKPSLSRTYSSSAKEKTTQIRRAYGYGPYPNLIQQAVVYASTLANFEVCPRRFRLIHILKIPESTPRFDSLSYDDKPPFAHVHTTHRAQSYVEVSTELGLHDTPDFEDHFSNFSQQNLAEEISSSSLLSTWEQARYLVYVAIAQAPLSLASIQQRQSFIKDFLQRHQVPYEHPYANFISDRIHRFFENQYLHSLSQSDIVRFERMHAFSTPLPSGVLLQGSIPFVVERILPSQENCVEIIDVKLEDSAKNIEHYSIQLRAYATALMHHAPANIKIVAGILFLNESSEPVWLFNQENLNTRETINTIDAIARRLIATRVANVWPRVPKSTCQQINCGFQVECNSRLRRTLTRDPQLSLFVE